MEPNKPSAQEFEESVQQILKTLPPVVRTYITERRYTGAAQSLMSQYKLRIDQGGVLEREILLLLMGVDDPNEFMETLATEARLDKTTIDSITRDINNQIFIPLRAEEMKASTAPKTPVTPPAVGQQGSHFQLQNKIPLPQKPAPGMPSLSSKPLDSSKLLEDHEEPHIEFGKRPAQSAPATPARTAPPPPNLPGQMPPAAPVAPRIIPAGGRAPGPIPPTVAPAGPAPVAKPLPPPAPPGLKFTSAPPPPGKAYSADPYREPIDETDV